MSYEFTLTALIPASPQDIYDAWLDSRGHSAMTGGKATQSRQAGDPVTAWDGYISGRNLELIPGRRIVQTWRTTQFTDAHADSVITVLLEPTAGGTRLTLVHNNVPDGQTSYEEAGWKTHYIEPMQKYFATAAKVAAVAARGAAAPVPKAAKKSPAKKAGARKKIAAKKIAKKSAKKSAAKKSAKKTSKKKPAKKNKARKAARKK